MWITTSRDHAQNKGIFPLILSWVIMCNDCYICKGDSNEARAHMVPKSQPQVALWSASLTVFGCVLTMYYDMIFPGYYINITWVHYHVQDSLSSHRSLNVLRSFQIHGSNLGQSIDRTYPVEPIKQKNHKITVVSWFLAKEVVHSRSGNMNQFVKL